MGDPERIDTTKKGEHMNWLELSDSLLMKRYCISIEDSGFTPEEFSTRYGDLPPAVAVEMFATDYDLQPLGCWS